MFGLFKGKKKKGAKPESREELIAQAQENARKAREEIGDETIQKIARALSGDNGSAGSRAREEIRGMDKGKVADNLKLFMDEKK